MPDGARPRVLRSALELPIALVDEIIEDMAERMNGTDEARRCQGLSFRYRITDRRIAPARYDVGPGGSITLSRDDQGSCTFTFSGESEAFDQILRGQSNALGAVMTRRVHMHGSLWHIRGLLRMMPAVNRAYCGAREAMMGRHSDRYDFRF